MVRIIGLLLISISCNAQSLNVLSLHQDKQLHVGYTYIISSATTSYVLKKTGNKRKAIFIGIGTGMAIGIGKEIYDARNGSGDSYIYLAIAETYELITNKIKTEIIARSG